MSIATVLIIEPSHYLPIVKTKTTSQKKELRK
jgi:hypothetical protein